MPKTKNPPEKFAWAFRATSLNHLMEPAYDQLVFGPTFPEHLQNWTGDPEQQPTHFVIFSRFHGLPYAHWENPLSLQSLEIASTPDDAWDRFRTKQKAMTKWSKQPVKRIFTVKIYSKTYLVKIQADKNLTTDDMIAVITSAARQTRDVNKALDIKILCDILNNNGYPTSDITPSSEAVVIL